MDQVLLISSFVLGIGGSLHCLGMCGPLAMSLPFSSMQKAKRNAQLVIYFLAKAFGYGLIGAMLGMLGKGFSIMNWQQALSVVAGIVMLALLFLPALRPKMGNFLFRRQFGHLYQAMMQRTRWYHFLLLGLLNAFLPCGLVYTALAAALVSAGAGQGFLNMFLFGIGTAPALMLMILVKHQLSMKLRLRLKPLSVAVSVLVALLLIVRGLDIGIPYLSPQMHAETNTVEQCCAKP
jgi:sulfite exporter TauE/SafE